MSDAFDMTLLLSFDDVQVDGEPDLIVELIDLYLGETPLRIVALEEAVTLRDQQALQRAAHCLKGSSASLGAGQVAVICEEIEGMANTSFSPEVAAVLNRLKQEFARVQSAFLAERNRRCA